MRLFIYIFLELSMLDGCLLQYFRKILSLANNGNSDGVIVKAHEPECCWLVEPGDEDCESMKLFGGFPAEIKPGRKKNITYVFPNSYPLDRVGSCKFHLKKLGQKAIVHEISFNTTLKDDTGSWMTLFEGGPKIYKRCLGIDENPRNFCKPINCAKKYNGYRNFFRAEDGKCEPVQHCRTKLGDDNLPTSAFDFEYNRCKSLIKDELQENEKKTARDIMEESPLSKQMKQYDDVDPNDLFINCKHGKQEGHYCRCKKGWKTVSVLTAGGGIKMDWCSKKVKIKKREKSHRYLKIALLTFLAAVCICMILLVLYLWWRLFLREIICVSKDEKYRKQNASENNANDFLFDYDPTWKIGDKIYDSNKTYTAPLRSEINDHSDGEMSEEELFVETTSQPIVSDTTESPRNVLLPIRPNSFKDQQLSITDSDRFVLVNRSINPNEEDGEEDDTNERYYSMSNEESEDSDDFPA